jgi:DNA mismatch repair protein MSH3
MTKVQPSISRFFLATKRDDSDRSVKSKIHFGDVSIDLTDEVDPPVKLEPASQARQMEDDLIHDNPISLKLAAFRQSEQKPLTPTSAEDEPIPITTIPSKRAAPRPARRATKATKSELPLVVLLTPLEKLAVQFKQENPDKILAIQVGYKYKFFMQDAVVVARILNIMLVPGKVNLDDSSHERLAYCSIPDNRIHVHLQRLLGQGLKVGVIKQTETAAIKTVDGNKNSLFERKLTGVYTRATYMDDEMLKMQLGGGSRGDERGQYIICIDELAFPAGGRTTKGTISFVAVLPSTGEILYETFTDDVTRSELETRLTHLAPSEIIVVSRSGDGISKEVRKVVKIAATAHNANVRHMDRKDDLHYGSQLAAFFATDPSLMEFYQTQLDTCTQACVGELIEYLAEFKLSNIFTVKSNVRVFSDRNRYMLLPANAMQSLEIFTNSMGSGANNQRGTLVWILDHTRTSMGERLMSKWIARPLIERGAIEERLDAIADLRSGYMHFIEAIMKQLDKIGSSGIDFEKCMIKIHYASTYNMDKIGRKECYLFLKSLHDLMVLVNGFDTIIGEVLGENKLQSALLTQILLTLASLSKSDVVTNLVNMINVSGAMNESDSTMQKVQFFRYQWAEIEEVQHKIDEVEGQLETELDKVRKILKRPQLNYVTNMKETHLVEVRNGVMTKNLPLDWIKINSTKSVSRYRTPAITQLLKQLNYHNDMLVQACDAAYNQFLCKIDSQYEYINKIVRCVLEFDCLLSLTAAASTCAELVRPQFVDEVFIDIVKGRNPIIESLKTDYIPNDVRMSQDSDRCLIVTGPNMGGKSSYVRQAALIVIMAQIGCYVPCESARLGVFDSIFTRMGAQDNIIKGESTFMVEMMECGNILQNCTERSLVILDEIGRGTGTTDGIAIAYAILDYFINKQCLTLFITHYPSLHTFEDSYRGLVQNYHMGFIERRVAGQEWPDIVFLYTVVKGVVTNLYGLNVAKLAGIPSEIVSSAYIKSVELRGEVEEAKARKFALEAAEAMKQLESADTESLYKCLQRLCDAMD